MPEDMMKEFPTVFDGQIKTMDGEEFYRISSKNSAEKINSNFVLPKN